MGWLSDTWNKVTNFLKPATDFVNGLVSPQQQTAPVQQAQDTQTTPTQPQQIAQFQSRFGNQPSMFSLQRLSMMRPMSMMRSMSSTSPMQSMSSTRSSWQTFV